MIFSQIFSKNLKKWSFFYKNRSFFDEKNSVFCKKSWNHGFSWKSHVQNTFSKSDKNTIFFMFFIGSIYDVFMKNTWKFMIFSWFFTNFHHFFHKNHEKALYWPYKNDHFFKMWSHFVKKWSKNGPKMVKNRRF